MWDASPKNQSPSLHDFLRALITDYYLSLLCVSQPIKLVSALLLEAYSTIPPIRPKTSSQHRLQHCHTGAFRTMMRRINPLLINFNTWYDPADVLVVTPTHRGTYAD